MYLFIDTSKEKTVVQVLNKDLGVVRCALKDGQKNQSENLLFLINEVTGLNKVDVSKIKGIFVLRGPGSYTGLRVGIATANTLAFAWGIKVLGVEKDLMISDIGKLEKSDKPVVPKYSYPPKITKTKPRL